MISISNGKSKSVDRLELFNAGTECKGISVNNFNIGWLIFILLILHNVSVKKGKAGLDDQNAGRRKTNTLVLLLCRSINETNQLKMNGSISLSDVCVTTTAANWGKLGQFA